MRRTNGAPASVALPVRPNFVLMVLSFFTLLLREVKVFRQSWSRLVCPSVSAAVLRGLRRCVGRYDGLRPAVCVGGVYPTPNGAADDGARTRPAVRGRHRGAGRGPFPHRGNRARGPA